MMDPSSVLVELDKHAAEFNFPVLDNAYVEFTAARLTAFLSQTDWLIACEVLGFSTREAAFVNDVYGYGSCVARPGYIGELIVAESLTEDPLFDSDRAECVADWSHWGVRAGKEELHFAPSLGEYEAEGIQVSPIAGPRSIQPIQLLRFLYHKRGDRLFADENILLKQFPNCKGMVKFLQTTDWQHPDVAGGEKPSSSPSFKSLIHALRSRDRSLFDPGQPNTTWRMWDRIRPRHHAERH